jgi:hypothetical protein
MQAVAEDLVILEEQTELVLLVAETENDVVFLWLLVVLQTQVAVAVELLKTLPLVMAVAE